MTPLEENPRFAEALEDCCRRVLRGEPLERCLAGYPLEYREELARLAPLARPLGRLARDPSPEFQGRLEQQLLAGMDEIRRTRQPGVLGRLRRFFAAVPVARVAGLAAAALVILAISGIGAVQASADSLPDNPLYRVKTAREAIQLALARDGEAKVNVYARQILQRGRELELAVRAGKPRPVVAALARRLGRATEAMVDQALERRARGRPEAAVQALAALRAMERNADQLIARVPREDRPPLLRIQSFLREQERRLMAQEGRDEPRGRGVTY